MTKNILFIGMDVQKESIEIAIADGASTEVRRYGKSVARMMPCEKSYVSLFPLGKTLHFCYEADPCGYDLY